MHMTLHDLTEQLSPQFTPSVQKDLKTAIRVLAQALQYPDAKSCPLEACLHPLPHLYQIIEAHLTAQGKSPHTLRNTKNNLSRLFRLAEAQALFSLLPAKLNPRFKYDDRPHRIEITTRTDGSSLRRGDWPPEVEAEFAAFVTWATDPLVSGREAQWKKRNTTIQNYARTFEAYFGYLHHVLKMKPVQFSYLFDFALIERFVLWHINDKWHRATRTAYNIVQQIHTMAIQYYRDPTLAASLKMLRKRMPPLHPVYNKSNAWVPLQELERVGIALWPSTSPEALQRRKPHSRRPHIGRKYAQRAGASLMLRLWVHIPYRQRNMREMKLDHNLYRTPEGQWRIRFATDELKVATKRGQPNVFDLPFPPTLVSTLETYLNTWRPILSRINNAPQVFLNRYGQPFNTNTIRTNMKGHIYRFTGRLWHPHMIRTTWATEWIQSSGDFMTAAIMLNDRLETVIKNYSHLREENVAENAYEWVQKRINHH
jgi:hypothetical protein